MTELDTVVTVPEVRRSTATVRTVDVIRLVGSALAAVGLTAWLFVFVLPIDVNFQLPTEGATEPPMEGVLGFCVIAYVTFLVIFGLLTAFDENRPTVRDRLASVAMHSLAFLMLLGLFSVVIYTVGRGLEPLGFVNFYTQDMSNAGPLDDLDMGGVLHAVVGTLIMISIALVLTIPLGILTAVFLSEYPGRFARFVRTVVEAMTALPSIVAGLFVYAVIVQFGLSRSGFAAACAITVMMLPIVVRSADVVLRLVPGNLKEAARARCPE